jgi:DNA-binding winged helix-turn-helix (wHTH) protein
MAIGFADFTLDPGTRRLLRAGGEVHVSPKAFDLLSVLIEHRARAMAKAELQALIWPGTFVNESNLASLVAELRRALGDSADAPRVIRTVPRFGYWFAAEVSSEANNAARPACCWLVWEAEEVALQAGDNVIGRADDASIVISAPGVSRRHAVVRMIDGAAILEDLGSRNGTYVGAERVTAPRRLADGDQLRFGSFVMTFRIPTGSEQTAPL